VKARRWRPRRCGRLRSRHDGPGTRRRTQGARPPRPPPPPGTGGGSALRRGGRARGHR